MAEFLNVLRASGSYKQSLQDIFLKITLNYLSNFCLKKKFKKTLWNCSVKLYTNQRQIGKRSIRVFQVPETCSHPKQSTNTILPGPKYQGLQEGSVPREGKKSPHFIQQYIDQKLISQYVGGPAPPK